MVMQKSVKLDHYGFGVKDIAKVVNSGVLQKINRPAKLVIEDYFTNRVDEDGSELSW